MQCTLNGFLNNFTNNHTISKTNKRLSHYDNFFKDFFCVLDNSPSEGNNIFLFVVKYYNIYGD